MSISIFYLPEYKDMRVSKYLYMKGKCGSCTLEELEKHLPIWEKMSGGKFAGSGLNLKRCVRHDEYSKYPCVFITSEYWPATENKKAHGSTCVHFVQRQHQNIENCLSYENSFVDREVGVVILEKTILHDGAKEPNFGFWFYDKDNRPNLPKEILEETFLKEKVDSSYFLSIEKLVDDNKYEKECGYLKGNKIKALFDKYLGTTSAYTRGIKLIEWQSDWNFVLSYEFGQTMLKVSKEDVLAFFEKNGISFKTDFVS